jgi:S-adenosylhomocysteine hydrolase
MTVKEGDLWDKVYGIPIIQERYTGMLAEVWRHADWEKITGGSENLKTGANRTEKITQRGALAVVIIDQYSDSDKRV